MSKLNPDNSLQALPQQAQFLVPYVLKYRIDSNDDIAVADPMPSAELAELRNVAARVKLHGVYSLVNEHLDKYPETKYDESVWLYWFFGLLDDLGLDFE
ncbi:hypothetical protein [Stratiformator vulcanicus]|uniref:Uncharacterized protein n=1 Tax=Stratiformator vulcanicus TaxID=2527980 RepID=A0A517QYX4_9PLAN|nr:hypothetical protein [Stratiformator vulcanicus]QDT36793.1 hypothetical protein Pan189_11560 [Stratiformator vulcanicus]